MLNAINGKPRPIWFASNVAIIHIELVKVLVAIGIWRQVGDGENVEA